MTAVQFGALIILTLFIGLVFWAGYRSHMIDGWLEGADEAKAVYQSENSQRFHSLEQLPDQTRGHSRSYRDLIGETA